MKRRLPFRNDDVFFVVGCITNLSYKGSFLYSRWFVATPGSPGVKVTIGSDDLSANKRIKQVIDEMGKDEKCGVFMGIKQNEFKLEE